MATENPDDLDKIDQEIRINELKERARESCGGAMHEWTSEDCPPGIEEQFGKHVLAFEEAPLITHFAQLRAAGVELPDPDSLDEQATHAKLWEVIEALARLRIFLSSTNQLSDRELYSWLWHEALREPTPDLTPDE
jgi:hypothetical protein